MARLNAVPRVGAGDHEAAIRTFRENGVIAIDKLVPTDTIDMLRGHVAQRHPEFADKALLSDYQDNGKGRFIAPVAITPTMVGSGLLDHLALAALAGKALGDDWVVDAFGMLMAFPGCPAQKPHRDGSPLFPETALAAILPTYALTILIPLVDVDAHNGATAFQLGTHRYLPGSAEREPSTAALPRGSALVWNFETLHWGLPNRSGHLRPALYLTFCRPFWTDMANFGGTARTRLLVDEAAIPLLDRRFARASSGRSAHAGLGNILRKVAGPETG